MSTLQCVAATLFIQNFNGTELFIPAEAIDGLAKELHSDLHYK